MSHSWLYPPFLGFLRFVLGEQVINGFTHQNGTRNPRPRGQLVQVVELVRVQVGQYSGSQRFPHVCLYKLSHGLPSRGWPAAVHLSDNDVGRRPTTSAVRYRYDDFQDGNGNPLDDNLRQERIS